ncbi:MAG: DUF4193 domain-containing protein [Actinomycetota bacterium]|nr:DUF4193 domain-containing protein [Actinomycetota bacterium]
MATDEAFQEDEFEEDALELNGLDELEELDDSEDDLETDLDEEEESLDEVAADQDELVEVEEQLDEDGDEESLDVLLAREQVLDDDDLLRLDDDARDLLAVADVPIGAGEFTCRSCFLVKRRAQLADETELICLDCA